MEFLKRMKSRERVEMSLKTIMGVIAGLILIILMEGMIFSIYLNKMEENNAVKSYSNNKCVAYCEKISDDNYKVYINNTEAKSSWFVLKSRTQEQIEEIFNLNQM